MPLGTPCRRATTRHGECAHRRGSCRRATTRHGERSCLAVIRRRESRWQEVRPDAAGIRNVGRRELALSAKVEIVARAVDVLHAGVLRKALANVLLSLGTDLKRQLFAHVALVRCR